MTVATTGKNKSRYSHNYGQKYPFHGILTFLEAAHTLCLPNAKSICVCNQYNALPDNRKKSGDIHEYSGDINTDCKTANLAALVIPEAFCFDMFTGQEYQ
jgi:hypothetical protein